MEVGRFGGYIDKVTSNRDTSDRDLSAAVGLRGWEGMEGPLVLVVQGN